MPATTASKLTRKRTKSAYGVSRTRATKRRVLKGYAGHRQRYDARRRRTPLDPEGKAFKKIVQADICAICHKAGPSDADHVQALLDGGQNVWNNLGGLCGPCNRAKKDQLLLLYMLARR